MGALLCVLLFAALILQGIFIALRAPDYFGTMIGIGITAQVAWQVFCHIGVVTATLPEHRHQFAVLFLRRYQFAAVAL